MDLNFIKPLIKEADSKIVFLILDGLGGLPGEDNLTELEKADTPNLDELAKDSICGLHQPVAAGITPGSGPSHIALFGYNPVKYQIGRGVLSALGIDFDLQYQDVAARGNFCTVDKEGKVTDRRAGRISTETNQELCKILNAIKLPEAEVFVETVKEHRFLLVIRGEGLSSDINDTDPQETGKYPHEPKAKNPDSGKTAKLVNEFIKQAKEKLSDQHPANMVLMRGFASLPGWPSFQQSFGLKAGAIAGYPMYVGLAKLLGMQKLEISSKIEEEIGILKNHWNEFGFFYIHVKGSDSAGEDGDFDRKVSVIEEVDHQINRLRDLGPDVIVITGDHSTPAAHKYHSWHPVPVLLWAENCRKDNVKIFGERECMKGGLGPAFPATDLIPLALANAGRLEKFGA